MKKVSAYAIVNGNNEIPIACGQPLIYWPKKVAEKEAESYKGMKVIKVSIKEIK